VLPVEAVEFQTNTQSIARFRVAATALSAA
jgi:hypothetical protein